MAELQQDPQPYELPEDDAYDERCAEVYITFKRHLVFHCCFCAQKYGNYRNFLKHFSKEHFDDDDEVNATASDSNEESMDIENTKNSLDVATCAEYFDELEQLEEQVENNEELVFIEQHVDYAEQPEAANYVQTEANNDDEYMHVEKLDYNLQANEFIVVQETNEILEEEYIDDEDDNNEHTNEKIVADTNAKQNAETFEEVLLDTVTNPHKNNTKTTIKLPLTKPLAKPLPKRISLLSLKESGKPPIKPEPRITKFMQKPKPFQCNVCQKIFSKKCRLDTHMKIHSDERRFQCIICGVAFKDKSNCKSHIRRHTEEKNFKCKFCAKAFFSRTECSIHERTHTGEKPYICAHCGKRFVAACSLTTHAKRHEDVRQFKCDVCERRFHLRAKLREHMVVHTGERPYHCKICSATFTRPQSLTQHKKLHVNALAYACKMCDKRFNQKPALISHMRSNHKVMDNTESAF